jgi:acetyltransferase-like isoleucine patch superfamily enzyme
MKIPNLIQVFCSTLRHAWINARIRARFSDATFDTRIAWQIDALDAIEIGFGVYVGPFSEIVVQSRSPHSSVAGRLILGSRCVVGSFANLRAAGGEIRLGANCLLAQNVTMIAANHECYAGIVYRDALWDEGRTGVTLGDNCWVGAGAIILPGVHIGENSIVGAGSVVTKSIPAGEIWARVPARKLGDMGSRKPKK